MDPPEIDPVPRRARVVWPWWVLGAVGIAVFCWMPGQVVALLQAVAGLGLVYWLLLQTVRFPREWSALLTSLARRTTVYESPAGHKVTLFADDQRERLADFDEAVRQRLAEPAADSETAAVGVDQEQVDG